ncbi:hypothetical protein S7711_11305 [Stachybotrys chartarum IBT 7711]|uniref:Uncharacterized protein n=1 Tax=Stachybotrys chartarum (strain CBS 109288 / IBT 7711) TaxID=1280523 RepID=A0A084AK35_STACB|nr:hypothetical protein S7711_11305 [Stachybotrys chartarum IBT 7711]
MVGILQELGATFIHVEIEELGLDLTDRFPSPNQALVTKEPFPWCCVAGRGWVELPLDQFLSDEAQQMDTGSAAASHPPQPSFWLNDNTRVKHPSVAVLALDPDSPGTNQGKDEQADGAPANLARSSDSVEGPSPPQDRRVETVPEFLQPGPA